MNKRRKNGQKLKKKNEKPGNRNGKREGRERSSHHKDVKEKSCAQRVTERNTLQSGMK